MNFRCPNCRNYVYEYDLSEGLKQLKLESSLRCQFLGESGQLYQKSGNLSDALKDYMEKSESADTIVICKGEHFPCHKWILERRSEYFRAALNQNNFIEGQQKTINIEDIDSDIFRVVLEVMYTDKTYRDLTFEKMFDLLLAADKLVFDFLRDSCGYWVVERLSVNNATEVLGWFIRCNVKEELKKNVKKFIMDNFREIIVSKDFTKLMKEFPDALEE